MKTLFAIYLVFFKGYSVVRFDDYNTDEGGARYGACDSPLGYDYTHSGNWGKGSTPAEAVIDCYNSRR